MRPIPRPGMIATALAVLGVACQAPPTTVFRSPSPKTLAADLGYGVELSGTPVPSACTDLRLGTAEVAAMMSALQGRFLEEERETEVEESLLGVAVDLAAEILTRSLAKDTREKVFFKGKWFRASKSRPIYAREEIDLLAPRIAALMRDHRSIELSTNDYLPGKREPASKLARVLLAPKRSREATRVRISCSRDSTFLGIHRPAHVTWAFDHLWGLDFRDPDDARTAGGYTFEGQHYDYMAIVPTRWSREFHEAQLVVGDLRPQTD